ncbi:MAG: quinolinate synthase NadA [Bacillota bacterium]|nr:quinolinate synthase NadA [Bacillota bacterium]
MIQDLTTEILRLKEEKDAVILAHYYQVPEVQEIADYVGDSYYLSKIAKDAKQNTIVFCGVRFMAESAKILSPNKTVLLPAAEAGCPMANMASASALLKMKEEYPNAKVVCYINSTTEVKAVSDVCCTSSNALNIINNIEEEEIIFLPDKNLGGHIQKLVPHKKMILWDGCCVTHNKIYKKQIEALKEFYPGAKVLVHPECTEEIRDMADFIGSTGEIIKFGTEDSSDKFIIVTEIGVLHELEKRNPNKKFYAPDNMVCPNMKKTGLEDVYNALKEMKNVITIDEDIRVKAYNALNNMHLLGR